MVKIGIIEGFEEMALTALEAAGNLNKLRFMPDAKLAERFADLLEERFLDPDKAHPQEVNVMRDLMERTFAICGENAEVTLGNFRDRAGEIIEGLRHATTTGAKHRTVAFHFCLCFFGSTLRHN